MAREQLLLAVPLGIVSWGDMNRIRGGDHTIPRKKEGQGDLGSIQRPRP